MTEFPNKPLFLCGIRLDALGCDDLIAVLDRGTSLHERTLILNHNLHSLYLYKTDRAFRQAYSFASWVYVDGMPVVWIGRVAGLRLTAAHRITLVDSFETILAAATIRGWRVYYLGSTEGILQKALPVLRERFPGLMITGHNGYFEKDAPGSLGVVAKINESLADILFVGMGMPLQEVWLAQFYPKLTVPVVLTSGATLDYVVGEAYRPPRWAGPLGLYGLFRLFADPKRLWRRYLLEPLLLLKYLGMGVLRQRLQAGTKQGGKSC